MIFGGYEFSSRTIKKYWRTAPGDSKAVTYLAGCGGGVLQTTVLVPLDLVKCRLQVDGQSKVRQYRGVFDCFRQVLRHEGVRGLYIGYRSTLLREVPSFGVYFLSYEIFKKSLLRYFDCVEESPAGLLSMIVAGGFAGMLTWSSIYPLDVIKVCTHSNYSVVLLAHIIWISAFNQFVHVYDRALCRHFLAMRLLSTALFWGRSGA